jgi:hypothetical protein
MKKPKIVDHQHIERLDQIVEEISELYREADQIIDLYAAELTELRLDVSPEAAARRAKALTH